MYDHLGVGGTTSEDDCIFSKDIDKRLGLGKYKDNNESGIDSEGESLNTWQQAQSSSGRTGTSTLYNPASPKSSTSDRGSSIQTSASDGQMIADALASIRDKVRIEKARPGSNQRYLDVSDEELKKFDLAGMKIVQFKKHQYEVSSYVRPIKYTFETNVTYQKK